MPKEAQPQNSDIKCVWVNKGSEPGCYCLHRPSQCRLKFPVDARPIHKCEPLRKRKIQVPEGAGFRSMVLPSREPNLYPAIVPRADFERLKQQAKIVTTEDQLAAVRAAEERALAEAAASAERKRLLAERLRAQPGATAAAGGGDPELEGPDQAAHTRSRGEGARPSGSKEREEVHAVLRAGPALQEEEMVGPRLASRVILASKCHAIRDAQLVEKQLIAKELAEEEKRLDSMMEENRVAAIKRAEQAENHRRDLRLSNLEGLKKQIQAHENARVMEAERIEEESIRVNQGIIATQTDEAMKLADKHQRQARLKEILDQCNADILYYKQLQNEEERIMEQRVQQFLRQRREREASNKAAADAVKAAKQKGIDHIAKAQKAEQELKEELERIRNLKIQEDVEREYRRKERDAAIQRNKDLRALHEARSQQINDIHRLIAREIAKDEQSFNNAAKQNEEHMRKEKEIQDKHKLQVEKHRREIMKQINDKEKERAIQRERALAEGVALRLERQQQEARERRVVKEKVATMRKQNVPEPYVKEVEQTLAKHGY